MRPPTDGMALDNVHEVATTPTLVEPGAVRPVKIGAGRIGD